MSSNIDRLIKKFVKKALTEAEGSTGTRIQHERRLADEIASLILDEQEEEEVAEEETEDLFADDPGEEDAPGDDAGDVEDVEVSAEEEVEPESPKEPRKMSAPKIAVGAEYKDFKHNFNIIRSAKAISKQVSGETMITKTGLRLREYFNSLSHTEKDALQEFMIGLAQVLIVGAEPEQATAPDIKSAPKEPIIQTGQAVDTDIEVTSKNPVKVVGTKLENLIRLRSKNI